MLILLRKLNYRFIKRHKNRQLHDGRGEALQRIDSLVEIHPCHLGVHLFLITLMPLLNLFHDRLHFPHPGCRPQLAFVKRVNEGLDEARVENEG